MERPRPRTKSELEEQRRSQTKAITSEFIDRYVDSTRLMLEFTIPSTKYCSGFCSNYVKNPNVRSKSELDALRKQKNLIGYQTAFKNRGKELNQLIESQGVAAQAEKPVRRNISDERRTESLENFKLKFAKRPIGLHGVELPKFFENLKDYWKVRQGYTENPVVRSKDTAISRPISEFARMRPKNSSVSHEIPLKPNEMNPFLGLEKTSRPCSRPKHSQDFQFRPRPHSTCEDRDNGSSATPVRKMKHRPFTPNPNPKERFIRSSGFSIS